jgi:hypothetical protein
MATRAPFLTQPYGAYYHRDIPKEDEELTHVGPGTPCGEYLRRFWQPVALSKRVQELLLRVRLLGEDLVVFRQNGQDPEHVLWEEGKVIPTYSNHTVKPVPKAPTPEAEAQLLRETGRQVAEGYLKDLSSLVEYIA